ncbi:MULTISPECIES: DUF413 domain-containing protein [Ferrimonas]|uniref:DUF413 domain-containing protein n=1 Tax=Ferrimonas TaxID=44011 RepID=UPI00040FE3C8|nr:MULTISPECIES: DUF413 domain-containing protein [Ferrimonas]USD35779.1 DUF413 domain-containing protein [Ferrimonas sp. SCSIO 43195]
MYDSEFRAGVRDFVDSRRFGRGFSRSGDFTIKESELLTRYGHTMAQLASGELTPVGEQEHRFVAVVAGLRPPTSALERVWLKYRQLSECRRRLFCVQDSRSVPPPSDPYLFYDD